MQILASMNVSFLSILILLSHGSNLNNGLSEPTTEWKNIVSAREIPALINRPYVVLFFAYSAVPKDTLVKRFNNHFSDTKGHLQDFGVEVAVIDCFTTPEFEECTKKKDASDKVHFFRNGRLLTDLPLDAMFNFDAIIANILHLILLQEVPLLQTRAELEKRMTRATGKYDVIFARMKAVGIPEDRAFVETAFAFNQKYQFIMTTLNDNFGIDSNWEPGSNGVWLLQCKATKPKEQCPVVTFMHAISLEKLIIFVKALEIPNAVELTDSNVVGFLHLNIPVVSLSGTSQDMSSLRSVMNTLSTEFVGNVGFILLNRDTVTDEMKSSMDLSMPLGCSTSCAILKTKDLHETVTVVTTDNLSIALKKILEEQRSRDLKDLQHEEEAEEVEDETNTEELYTTAQETQDDPVEHALFKLKAQRKLNVSETTQLTDKTFPEFISSDSITMVLFTVKWNPVCAAFLEAYQKIGLKAKALNYSKINPMARVECSNWPDVCQLNNVTYYPTMKIFRNATFIKDYLGRLDEQNLLRSFFLHSISSPVHLDTRDQFVSFHQGSYPSTHTRDLLSSAVVGIFPDPKNEGRIIFEQVAQQLEGSYLLSICTQECAHEGLKVFELKNPAIVTVKWKDPYQPFVVFRGTFNKPSILNFIRKSSQNILPELNPASLPSLVGHQKGVVMLFHQLDNQSKQAESELAKVAMKRQFESTPITWIDSASEGRLGRKILTSYSLPVEIDKPQIIFLNRRINSVCWYPHAPLYSESLLTDWLDGALAGEAGPCAAALRHREWKEMVEAYDFLAYIKEDEEAEEKIGQVNIPSGRIRQVKSQKETKEPQLPGDGRDGAGDGAGSHTGAVKSEGITTHKHTEL